MEWKNRAKRWSPPGAAGVAPHLVRRAGEKTRIRRVREPSARIRNAIALATRGAARARPGESRGARMRDACLVTGAGGARVSCVHLR